MRRYLNIKILTQARFKAATLVEALIASVIVVSIIAGGFVMVQQHLQQQYQTKLKLNLVQRAQHYLEESITRKDYFSYIWDAKGSEEIYSRSVTPLDKDGLVQINISANHPSLHKPIILSRIVEVKE